MNVEQALPVPSQRCQEKSNVMGCDPVQSPWFAVSVAPCCAFPEIDGSRVATGACPLAVTTSVGFDVAEPLPAELVAVTSTRIRCPTSVDETVYRKLFAPPIGAHVPPSVSHCSH